MFPDTVLYFELALFLLAIGAAGGFLSGLLGVGGGIVFVPALFFCLRILGVSDAHVMHIAVGTSLAIVAVTSFTSAFHHDKRSSVDRGIVRRWGPYIVTGVLAGALFAASVDGHMLRNIFAALMLVIAVYYMVLSREAPDREIPAAFRRYRVPPVLQHGLCLLIGAVSSMIGVGGAILTIPLLTLSGESHQRATGTGSALGVAVALPGMVVYMISGFAHAGELPPFSLGYVNPAIVAMIIPLAVLLSPVGVKAAHRLPQAALRRIFALALAFMSLRMFMTL